MNQQKERRRKRIRRHLRVRKKVFGTPERPRLTVYRSLKHIHAQIIDDLAGRTLAAASTQSPDLQEALVGKKKTEAAKIIGKRLAEKALAHGIRAVVMDRAGYKYHGRVKALADAAREVGLIF